MHRYISIFKAEYFLRIKNTKPDIFWLLYSLQADSAIVALNCSGVLLGALPIRYDLGYYHIFRSAVAYVITSYLLCRVSPSKTAVRPPMPRSTSYWSTWPYITGEFRDVLMNEIMFHLQIQTSFIGRGFLCNQTWSLWKNFDLSMRPFLVAFVFSLFYVMQQNIKWRGEGT